MSAETLKYEAASALARALAFVLARGGSLDRLRARALLGALSTQHFIAALSLRQSADGSFAPLGLAAGGEPGFEPERVGGLGEPLLGSLEALVVLSDLAALGTPPVEGLARYLERAQQPDGGWGDTALPVASRIFASGLLAGTLARTRCVRPSVLEAAGRYLEAQWGPGRIEGGQWASAAAFGAFFSNVDHPLADAALQWIGREIERGFRSGALGALVCTRALLHCDAAAVPGAQLAPPDLLRALLADQSADGGFAAEAPSERRLAPTIAALLAIIRLCALV